LSSNLCLIKIRLVILLHTAPISACCHKCRISDAAYVVFVLLLLCPPKVDIAKC